MKIMALDTSGQAVSVAVAEDGRLLSHIWLRHGKTHAEALMPCVQATLSGLSMEMCDIGAFAVISGPGSFTGLRIGIATVKAFAYANNALVVGIPTHDALAHNLAGYPDTLICPVMDARNGNIYQSIYRYQYKYQDQNQCQYLDQELEKCQYQSQLDLKTAASRLADTSLLDTDEAARRLKSALETNPGLKRVIFNGDAAYMYIDFFRAALDGFPCAAAPEPELNQNAASAALLACEAAEGGLLVLPGDLAPRYYNEGYMAKKIKHDNGQK